MRRLFRTLGDLAFMALLLVVCIVDDVRLCIKWRIIRASPYCTLWEYNFKMHGLYFVFNRSIFISNESICRADDMLEWLREDNILRV